MKPSQMFSEQNMFCGPIPGGEIKIFTPPMKVKLTEFARKHAPQFVPHVQRTEFYRQANPEWIQLLDRTKQPVGLNVHISLWDELFPG